MEIIRLPPIKGEFNEKNSFNIILSQKNLEKSVEMLTFARKEELAPEKLQEMSVSIAFHV